MKKMLLIALLAMGTSLAHAQTKGTNTVGLGVNLFTGKSNYDNQPQANQKSTSQAYSLSYGYFFKDNQKLNLNLQYERQSYTSDKSNGYGVGLSYQKYYPLFKSFYAVAGGGGNYMYSKSSNTTIDNNNYSERRSDSYSVAAVGGLSWFVSKRIALEVNLLSIGAGYVTSKSTGYNSNSSSRFTAFNLSTAGVAGNLGFKVHILF